jgi:hypothetical protein
MNQQRWTRGTVSLAVVLVAGVVFAANMAFNISYQLPGVIGTGNGTVSIGLPQHAQTDITNAKQLIDDIETSAGNLNLVLQIQRYAKASNSFESYTGSSGVPGGFPIVPGEGYLVQTNAAYVYTIVGSEDPAFNITLEAATALRGGPITSLSGKTFYAYPYNSCAANAKQLIDEINTFAGLPSVVLQIERYLPASNSYQSYTGSSGATGGFPLAIGESYLVQVSSTVNNFDPCVY